MRRKFSRIDTANRKVSFARAASWSNLLDGSTRARGTKTSCPFCFDRGGRDPSFRIYEDHGYCFAGCGYFSTTRLLAEYWQLPEELAAQKALDQIGWRPPTVDNLWKEASEPLPPDLGALEIALRTYCASLSLEWEHLKYTSSVGGVLSSCLGALPQVHTEEESVEWLSRCKVIMAVAIGGSGGSE